MTDDKATYEGWTILEIMGHRRLVGYIVERTIAGAGFLEIRVPAHRGQPALTQLYRPESVYCITPTDEATAMGLLEPPKELPPASLYTAHGRGGYAEIAREAAALAEAEGEYGDDEEDRADFDEDGEDGGSEWEQTPDGARLHLGADEAAVAATLIRLHLVGETDDITTQQVGTWSDEERRAASEWALSVHFAASDNDDVIVPERPECVSAALVELRDTVPF